MFELVTAHGIYRGDYLKKWLDEKLAGNGVHTFADLPTPMLTGRRPIPREPSTS